MSAKDSEIYLETQDGERRTLPSSGKLVLGSSTRHAGWVVSGEGVEGAHCAIGRLKDGGWALKDLGTRSGTRVNGMKVQSTRLQTGDAISLGDVNLRLVDPSAQAPAPAPAKPPAASTPKPTGDRRIAGFRVERVLGRGGMGEVLLAVQESLNRHVALKVLSPELAADRAFVLNFHSEARAAAALSHPNVVVVHDVGEADGQHFLVMEFMPGGSLEDRVARDGSIPWREVLKILHDAASGLSYAEAQGIVHRDIKPANLMIAASGAVKIADLGLATDVGDQGGGDQAEGRKTFGTPHFISPEQARGAVVDHRSDLYSLGATAYRLLTGRTPFSGDTAREIVRARFQTDPAHPSEFVPAIAPDLEALVMRLMAREPKDRFPTAQSLLREVDRLRLESDHGSPTVVEVEKPLIRRVFPIAVGLIIVVSAIVAAMILADDAPGEPDSTGADPIADTGADTGAGGEGNSTERDGGSLDDETFFGGDTRQGAGRSDDERALRLLELEAEVALRRIPTEYSTEDRLAALADIVADFGPTNIAREAQREIDQTAAAQENEQDKVARRDSEIGDALARMERAAGWPPDDDGAVPAVEAYVARVGEYQVSLNIATDPSFITRRAALVDQIIEVVEARTKSTLQRAEDLAAAGAFGQVRSELAALVAPLTLPEASTNEPPGYARIRALLEQIQVQIARVDAEEATHLTSQIEHDRALLAGAVGSDSSLVDDLGELDLDRIAARVTDLSSELSTEDAVLVAMELRTRIERCRSAISTLQSTFAAGAWRRRAVSVPNGRRSAPRDVVGVQAGGLLISGPTGGDFVPWSTFVAAPDDFASLFRGRLSRDYTDEENQAILSVLTVSAVHTALELARPALSAAARNAFDPNAAVAMEGAFASARAWAKATGIFIDPRGTGAGAELARERDAARLLAEGLSAAQLEEWSHATSSIEHLLTAYADTLCVLALSDGSFRPEPAPAPDKPAPAASTDESPSPTDGN